MRSASGRTSLVVFAASLLALPAYGQTLALVSDDALVREDVGSFHLGVDMAGLTGPRSFQLKTRLLPKQSFRLYPDLAVGLRPLGRPFFPGTAGGGTANSSNAHASHASVSASCRQPLPFQQPPVDADGILTRCNNAGLWNLAVTGLRILSDRANSSR